MSIMSLQPKISQYVPYPSHIGHKFYEIFTKSASRVTNNIKNLALPIITLIGISYIKRAMAGPITYAACLAACSALGVLAPVCFPTCLPLLAAPTP